MTEFCLTCDGPAPSRHEVVDSWFANEFWPLYPRKVGKDDALKWCRTHAKSASARVFLRKGIEAWQLEFAGRDTEYVPYPGTWLRKGHWKEESWPKATRRVSPLQQSKTLRAAALWLQQGGGQ